MLLYPERGLVLNATAADVVKLCTGEHTVAAIVERLAEKYAPQPAEAVEREVLAFLHAMVDRGLIRSERWAATPRGRARWGPRSRIALPPAACAAPTRS